MDVLVRALSVASEHGLRERFARAAATRRKADESVEKGRSYVAAYVDLVHYAERLLQSATAPVAAHDEAPTHAENHVH